MTIVSPNNNSNREVGAVLIEYGAEEKKCLFTIDGAVAAPFQREVVLAETGMADPNLTRPVLPESLQKMTKTWVADHRRREEEHVQRCK